MFETLNELPLIEEYTDGKYAYPIEVQNKLYVYKGQYVVFNGNSYEQYPRSIIDLLVENALSLKYFPENNIEETDLSKIDEIINNKLISIKESIDKYIEENSNKVSSDFDLDQFKKDIILELTSTITKSIDIKEKPEIESKNISDIINRLENAENNIKELKEELLSLSSIKSNITELSPCVINNGDINNENNNTKKYSKINLQELKDLKENGLSFSEIIVLKQMGLM
jgi:hypothetical protein